MNIECIEDSCVNSSNDDYVRLRNVLDLVVLVVHGLTLQYGLNLTF